MQPLKPYAFLNESSNPKTLDFRLNCSGSSNYDIDSVTANTSDNDLIVVDCNITSGSGGVQTDSYTIPNNAPQSKILLRVMDGSVVKGTVTVRLNENDFIADPLKPFVYLKLISGSDTEIFFWLDLPGSSNSISANPTITTDAVHHRVILVYDVISGSDTEVERNYDLSAYDPSTYYYAVVVIEAQSVHKGKGTSTEEDADSS
ncbi:MAG: hypothetical protein ACHQFW_09010 [Chitinophagales bacterium]